MPSTTPCQDGPHMEICTPPPSSQAVGKVCRMRECQGSLARPVPLTSPSLPRSPPSSSIQGQALQLCPGHSCLQDLLPPNGPA